MTLVGINLGITRRFIRRELGQRSRQRRIIPFLPNKNLVHPTRMHRKRHQGQLAGWDLGSDASRLGLLASRVGIRSEYNKVDSRFRSDELDHLFKVPSNRFLTVNGGGGMLDTNLKSNHTLPSAIGNPQCLN